MAHSPLVLSAALVLAANLARLPAQQTWLPAPLIHEAAAMAFDAARERLVVIANPPYDGSFHPVETWEWNGIEWIERAVPVSPGRRVQTDMVYDPVRRRTVLFGGFTGASGSFLDDTWEYDGATWTQRNPVTRPSARGRHKMVYDSVRQRVVLFGGYRSSAGTTTYPNDLWEWDGNQWTQAATTWSPPGHGHAMAYDPLRQRVVVFGGRASTASSLSAVVYEWDGTAWSAANWAPGPVARESHGMAYDPLTQRVVVWGGYGQATNLGDTWEWDGSTWLQRVHATYPDPAAGHLAAFDTTQQRMLFLAGGGVAVSPTLWQWTGTDWAQLTADPGARFGQGMGYDRARQRLVMFGGQAFEPTPSGTVLGDTWEFDGAWHPMPTASYSPSIGHVLFFDAALQQVLRFGGSASFAAWNGTNWQNLSPSSSPGALTDHAIAYDSQRRRAVLFGGVRSGNRIAETWEWDGANWSQRTPAARPSARQDHAMAYDAVAGNVVLFGGYDGSYRNDTWVWNGVNWSQRATPSFTPSLRAGHTLTYDPGRNRVVLMGGRNLSNYALYGLFEWDGASWSSQAYPVQTFRLDGTAEYDESLRRIVTYGGYYDTASLSAVWFLGNLQPAAVAVLGAGCAGANGAPQLTSASPFLGNPALAIDIVSAYSAAPAIVGLSLGSQTLSLGAGCTAYVTSPLLLYPTFVNASGFASVSLSLPAVAGLRGLPIYAQGLIVDPTSPLGLVVTNALSLVVGD